VKRRYPDAPVASVGVVVVRQGRVLLAQRGQPPSEGLWAFPGGGVELGETLEDAAAREVLEECGIQIRAARPFTVVDRIFRDAGGSVEYHYVIVDMLAEWVDGELRAATDVRQARWFSAEELRALPLTPGVEELAMRALGGVDQIARAPQ
jgi:ADP-ribose pyrophosphatase